MLIVLVAELCEPTPLVHSQTSTEWISIENIHSPQIIQTCFQKNWGTE